MINVVIQVYGLPSHPRIIFIFVFEVKSRPSLFYAYLTFL